MAIGAGVGFAGGFILGGAIGLASGDDEPAYSGLVIVPGFRAGEKALIGGLIAGVGGCLLGTGLGAIRTS